ncbi:MAG: hypothetical protein AAGD96_20810 [Chloroflexota bacterium]
MTQIRYFMPVALLFICIYIFQYDPPVEAIEGYELIHLTDPGLIGGVHKNLQSLFEITPCEYEILGWDNADNLFFVAICRGVRSTYVFHHEELKVIQNPKVPQQLNKNEIPPWEYRNYLLAGDVWPSTAEKPTRRLYVQENGVVSPDGKNIAFVTQRIYSVQDVLILKFEES